MSRTIYSRTVRRWFFNGKGFGTKKAALRAAAKSCLNHDVIHVNRLNNKEELTAAYAFMFPVCPSREKCPISTLFLGCECWSHEHAGIYVRTRAFCKVQYTNWLVEKAKEIEKEQA